jgi:hypothetical protein
LRDARSSISYSRLVVNSTDTLVYFFLDLVFDYFLAFGLAAKGREKSTIVY